MNLPIIFFDDYCVLCSRSVRFIYKYDKKGQFRFSSIESEKFRDIAFLLPDKSLMADSVLLYLNGKIYSRSAAALRIAWRLRFPIPLIAVGFIIPPFIRDSIYDLIARNRYRWFGKRDNCYIPDEELKKRFYF